MRRLRTTILAGLFLCSSLFPKELVDSLSYKFDILCFGGKCTLKIYDLGNNAIELYGKVEPRGLLSKIIPVITKFECRAEIRQNQSIYTESGSKKTHYFDLGSKRMDILSAIYGFLGYCRGDSLEKHPIFSDNSLEVFVKNNNGIVKNAILDDYLLHYHDKIVQTKRVTLKEVLDNKTNIELYIFNDKVIRADMNVSTIFGSPTLTATPIE